MCCTTLNSNWSQAITVCLGGSDNCKKALVAYHATF
jgi:hypothetical protein